MAIEPFLAAFTTAIDEVVDVLSTQRGNTNFAEDSGQRCGGLRQGMRHYKNRTLFTVFSSFAMERIKSTSIADFALCCK